MSLPELIPSNLPQFVRLTPRSAFANSVVPQGCALYFAEPDGSGGAKFLYKNPDGSYTEVGGGGGGGSMDFYRCASIDTTNHTWAGYLASLIDGIYKYAKTLTYGLTYDPSSTYTPEIGETYSADCLVRCSPYQGHGPAAPKDITSDMQGDWILTSDSTYGGQFSTWRAFNDGDQYWMCRNAAYPHWIMWQNITEPTVMLKYRFRSGCYASTHAPAVWELLGSNDSGTTWETIDAQSGVTWLQNELKGFLVSSPKPYRWYKLNMITGVSGNYACVKAFETNF